MEAPVGPMENLSSPFIIRFREALVAEFLFQLNNFYKFIVSISRDN